MGGVVRRGGAGAGHLRRVRVVVVGRGDARPRPRPRAQLLGCGRGLLGAGRLAVGRRQLLQLGVGGGDAAGRQQARAVVPRHGAHVLRVRVRRHGGRGRHGRLLRVARARHVVRRPVRRGVVAALLVRGAPHVGGQGRGGAGLHVGGEGRVCGQRVVGQPGEVHGVARQEGGEARRHVLGAVTQEVGAKHGAGRAVLAARQPGHRLQPLHVVLVLPHGLRPPGRSGGGGGPHGPVAAAAEAAVRGGRTVAASPEVCPCCVRGELLLVQLLGPINHCCSSAWAPAIDIICLVSVQTFKKESDPC